MDPFLGTEALAAGSLTRYRLKTRFELVHRNVYALNREQLTPVQKARAAWLWSGRRGTLVGLSAAAVLGSRWIDARLPAELNQRSQHKTPGIVLRADTLGPDEIVTARGMPVTSPARTAFDLGRRRGLTLAVIRMDALMRTTGATTSDIATLLTRHKGARGLVQLRRALELVDPASESPQESRTRLLLVKAGLPPERSQIDVFDRDGYHVGRVDMGWETWKVGVEYEGEQHWTNPEQYAHDIDRQAALEAEGWRIIRVSAEILRDRPTTIVSRVWLALRAAGAPMRPPNLNL
ncbi:endonuclease domain-containing protein [Mycolicibacterium vanbaalenii]|uniref:endonuclease domain-containing protein n=1 Tax=Mycolicibacterium vanbaalenii TaxID=110539 RepID=UPI0023BA56D7|nr:DUF559 domain-containing protein [Mycolicibacterium vanbaalenii]